MGVFTRSDSKYFWMNLERPGQRPLRQSTGVLVDAPTPGQRRDQRALAEQKYAVRMGELAKAGYQMPLERPVIGFTEFATWYDQNVIVHHRGSEKDRSRLKLLCDHFTDRPLHTIDVTLVQEWVTARRKQVSARSVNRELDDLKLMLTKAVPRYLAASPLVGFRRLRTEDFEARVLTPAEYDRLLAAIQTIEEEALLVTAVNTLLRLGSLLALEWRHDKGDHFRTLNAKVRQMLAPISPDVRDVLDRLPHSGTYLFATDVGHRGGGPSARENYIKRLFAKLCARAEVPHGRQVHGVTFHSIRHTGATWALQRTGNLKAVMQLGGWKTVPQCLAYAVSNTAEVQAVAASLSRRKPTVLKLARTHVKEDR